MKSLGIDAQIGYKVQLQMQHFRSKAQLKKTCVFYLDVEG